MKSMKSSYRVGLSLSLAGLSCVVAAACGSGKDESLTTNGAGGLANGDAGSGSGFQLELGGDSDGSLAGNGSGNGSGLGDGGAGCGFTRIVANPPVINVLLVVDKSASMDDEPSGFADSKWTALRSALADTLDQTQAKINYGLDLFPYSGKSGQALTESCEMPLATAPVVVPVQDGAKSAPLILAALDANSPSGATPTAAALTRAYSYFKTGAGKALTGEKYVLLATDGGPNCNPALTCAAASCTVNMDGNCPDNVNCCDTKLDKLGGSNCLDQDASATAIKKLLADQGVKTIVVGIPGTEAYVDTLNALADQSGVANPDAPPSYFAVSAKSGVAGLSDVLGHITTGLVKSCELHLEEAPPDTDKLFVVIDGVQIDRDTADGWTIPDPSVSPPVLEIQGTTCDKLESDGAEYINVTYGCPDFRPPVK
jgi:hypothetical protein